VYVVADLEELWAYLKSLTATEGQERVMEEPGSGSVE
jgi:hypothetical protein